MVFTVFVMTINLSAQVLPKDSVSSVTIDEIKINAPLLIQNAYEWPGGYSKIDSLQIHSGDGYTLSKQLNTIPGVFMQQGTLSTNRITIRGIGSRTPYNSNRIKAYWGDIPLTDGDGVTAIEDLGLNEMSDIQVLKGPASALYGAGLGGVVLISPYQFSKQIKKVLYKSEIGSYTTFLNQVNVNILHNKVSSFNINAGYLQTDGYRENSNYKRTNLTLNAFRQHGDSHFKFYYHFRNLNGQIPSSLDSMDFYDNPHLAASNWKQIKGFEKSYQHIMSGGWALPINNQLANSFTLYYQMNSLNELRPFNRLKEVKNGLGLRDKLIFSNNLFKGIVGFELMGESNKLKYYSVNNEDYGSLIVANELERFYANLFGTFEIRVTPEFLIQSSINLNRTKYSSMLDQKSYLFDWVVSPRLGINYSLRDKHFLYGSIGHGFSNPSFEESQMDDGSFNENIKPEQGWGCELGYRYKSSGNRLLFDLTLYQMNLNDLLVTKRESEDVFYGINAGKTKHYGLESSFKFFILRTTEYRAFYMSLNYFTSKNEFVVFVDDGVDQKGNQLPGIPNYILSYGINGFIKPFKLNVSYKNIGKQYLTDDNSNLYKGYQKLDAKVTMDINLLKLNNSVYIGCNNLFNEHYASMVLINASSFGNNKPRYYYPGLPFNIYGGMVIKW